MSLVQIEKREGYDILIFNRGKANPINTDFCQELLGELKRIDSDDTVRGVIFTGNTPGYFSVGLDLKELYYYNKEAMLSFWEVWDELLAKLIRYKKPIISAINGYSPAGGCVLAVTCDYRVMADEENLVIGLNETAVGIAVPEYIFLMYQYWIGKNRAYQYLMDGKLLTTKEAHQSGLVDEAVPMDKVLERAERKMKFWLSKPDNIIQNSKMNLRGQLIRELDSAPIADIEEKLNSWFDPQSRLVMKAIVDSLTK